jgi:hypothetical protein
MNEETMSGSQVGTIVLDRVRKTYNGLTGCACGCGGDYYVPTGRKSLDYDVENDRAVTRRVSTINKNLDLARVWDFGDEFCYEVVTSFDEDGDPARCTRVYVTKEVSA